MRKILIVLLVCLFSISVSVAQEQKEELAVLVPASWEEMFPFKDISEWLGEEFIFLPMQPGSQKYGYQSFHQNPKKSYESLPYENYAGKIVKVVSVTEARGYKMWDVMFEVEGKKVYVKNIDDSVMGIGYLADISTARRLFIGKTVWYRSTQLVSYDQNTEEFSHTDLKKWSPVEIVGVEPRPSYLSGNAIVLLRSPKGEFGYTDVVLSGTNVSKYSRSKGRFLDKFLVEDPRITYDWPPLVWSVIEVEGVSIGMSKEQVRMSWGDPEDINSTTTAIGTSEQWVYTGDRYLYFRGGKLRTIQN